MTAASLVTVERDAQRAAVARERLGCLEKVDLHVADWRDVLPDRAPFAISSLLRGRLLFGHPHVVAVEVLTTPSTAAIVAAKRA